MLRAWIQQAKVEQPAPGRTTINVGDARCTCGEPVDAQALMKRLRPSPMWSGLAVALSAAAGLAWVLSDSWLGPALLVLAVLLWIASLRQAFGLTGIAIAEISKRAKRPKA